MVRNTRARLQVSSHAAGFNESVKAEDEEQKCKRDAGYHHSEIQRSVDGRLLVFLPEFHRNRNHAHRQKQENHANQYVKQLLHAAEHTSQE
jgi:hypothetical protein